MPPLIFRLLGPLVIEHDGTAVDLKRAKSNALIAYLACNPQRHSRNHLVSLLWPEVDERKGLASLRTTLWALQRQLGNDWLEADRINVRMRSEGAVWVDVHHFQRLLKEGTAAGRTPSEAELGALERAVALYRDRLLRGLALPDCAAFDEWLSMSTERHHLLATQALERLASTLVSRGRLVDALPHAQRLVEMEPTHEEGHRALMRLYGWLGRWADALRQHQACLEVLREELDVPPQTETLRLLEALKARALPPAPSAAPAVTVSTPEQAPSASALPLAATPLHGRAHELRVLLRHLEDPACRLLTLTGPGGIGKTRLAQEAAHRRAGAHHHGARFISLAAVDLPSRLATFLVEALALPASPVPAEVQLREHLRSRDVLLVLDNLEHLLRAVPLLAELLAHAPGLKLLVTSRERLNLRGEWVQPLDGLSEREALELFTLLATRAEASFRLGPDNEAAVARVCQLVGHSPLGLELAAAWAPFFSPTELASRLEKDLDFLAASRDAPERHQSLRATFLHSWRLLSGEEQGVLRRLSVFRSAAPMEAAGAVAGATLALLTSLMNKSLVRRTASGHVELHGLVRQYAWEQLRALPEEHARTYQRHSEYFLGKLGRLEPLLRSGVARQGEALATFEAEQAEFRAAGLWAARAGHWQLIEGALEAYGLAQELTGRPCAFVGLEEIIAALRPVLVGVERTSPLRRLLGRLLVWQARVALSGATGNPSTALARVEEGLLLLGEQGAHADVISGQLTAGRLALQQGNVAGARWCLHGALSLARASGNHHASAVALGELAEVSAHRGRPEQARRLLARGLATFRLLGDERHVAACLGQLATLLHARGELEKADSALRQSMGVLEAAGLRLQVVPLRARLAGVLLQRGALEEARQAHTTNLQLGRALGHPETVAQALHGLGLVATAQGDTPQAREHHEEALVLRGQLGARRPLAESLMALGRLELSEGNVPKARDRLHAALRIAIEVGSPWLLLDVLVSLAELPATSEHGDRLHRALQSILSHPLTPHDTRQRAVALLPRPPPPPAPPSARPQLSHLVEEVLAAVGME